MDHTKSHVSFYLDRPLRLALEREAEQHDRSLSGQLRAVLREHVSGAGLLPPEASVGSAPEVNRRAA